MQFAKAMFITQFILTWRKVFRNDILSQGTCSRYFLQKGPAFRIRPPIPIPNQKPSPLGLGFGLARVNLMYIFKKMIMYCCFGRVVPTAGTAPKMLICQAGSAEVNARTEKWCDTADEILEYMVGEDRLRDVITQVKVWDRTI